MSKYTSSKYKLFKNCLPLARVFFSLIFSMLWNLATPNLKLQFFFLFFLLFYLNFYSHHKRKIPIKGLREFTSLWLWQYEAKNVNPYFIIIKKTRTHFFFYFAARHYCRFYFCSLYFAITIALCRILPQILDTCSAWKTTDRGHFLSCLK